MSKLPKKQIIDAALAMAVKDRQSLAEKLMKSLPEYDSAEMLETAKVAHRRIREARRDPSRRVSEEEIERLLSE